MILYSPAKINLYFRVLRRREDGYHEIASLMQAVSLFDELTIELSDQDYLSCSDPKLPTDSRNLVLKAVDLFRKKTCLNAYFKISLQKKIPHEAGLGGGSSNAATTLWGINKLLGFPATQQQLQHWSADIGSDVPFFFSQGSAHCTGRGEHVDNVSPFTASPLTIVKPDFGLSTPQVFSHCRPQPDLDYKAYFQKVLEGTEKRVNDLESAALELAPQLISLKQELHQHLKDPIMTGSGSAFFGMGDLDHRLDSSLNIFSVKSSNRSLNEWYKPCH